jgi:hypothetical protein
MATKTLYEGGLSERRKSNPAANRVPRAAAAIETVSRTQPGRRSKHRSPVRPGPAGIRFVRGRTAPWLSKGIFNFDDCG